MPNHCLQQLEVSGPLDDVVRFKDAVLADYESCIAQTYLPFPKELEGETVDGHRVFTPEGYEWCIENWGTKWGDYDLEYLGITEYESGRGMATFTFCSAWSPMEEGLRRISEIEPTLFFFLSFEELDGGFMGSSAFRKGERVANSEITELPEYPHDDFEDYEKMEAYYDELIDLRDKHQTETLLAAGVDYNERNRNATRN